jgi:hypothetical protein
MVDSYELSLSELCSRTGCLRKRKPLGKSSGPDNPIKTIYWYRGFTLLWPANTAYAIGKRVEPSAYWVIEDGGKKIHLNTNKWSGYQDGKSVPQAKLLMAGEQARRGSAMEINHPLWQLVGREWRDLAKLGAVARLFTPQIQTLLDGVAGQRKASDGKIIRVAEKLQMLDTLDSIGSLILAHLQSRLCGDKRAESLWARSIYQGLMIHGGSLIERGVALPLFDLIQEDVLKYEDDQGRRWTYPRSAYLPAVRYLQRFAMEEFGFLPHAMASIEARKFIQDCLSFEGGYGFDLAFALNAFLQPAEGWGADDHLASGLRALGAELFDRACGVLSAGERHRAFPSRYGSFKTRYRLELLHDRP